ncbi:MAG: hypothetical protein WBM06_19530, partial [Pseudolabrys sp.]
PEYVTLMDGLQDIDPESDAGVDIQAALAALDKSRRRMEPGGPTKPMSAIGGEADIAWTCSNVRS